MIKRILIVLLFTVLILGGIFGFKFYQIQQAISQMVPPPPAVVAAATVKQEQWSSSLSAVGSLTAISGVDVSNEVVGKIKTIHFESGQSVKQGQLLVELDADTDLAELKGLQAEQDFAQVRFERSEKMIEKKYVSRSDYDQHKAMLDQAMAAVQAKKTLIDKKMIRAPFNGELGIRQVNLGEYLAEGKAIVSLQKLDPIYLDFSLPERHVSQLAKNQPISATVQAYPDRYFSGRIMAISPAVERDTRALKVRALVANQDKALRPGMFAQVQIKSGSNLQVLTLPDTAISYNPYGDSVFLIEQTEKGLTVQSRQVVTGQTREGRVEIVSGLRAGDKVVSAGQVKLRNGMPVTLDSQPAPGEREPIQ
ncbi:efflux RND transporter periplasmic adaptor subunit [Methylomonas sp. LL1]|uniref:efflux RND transporter periplasmic adaptor subunit n=1 Tax=Methylomonas sp. LL1 TaxID=2785785 RepID=UPI0018C3F48B|nr:efflux RND transporter periplasmic adaptor subunit [Methylomonas sp. LL1]QPK64550.1 efflux RND transporter periplasmic adaptor subunit [Methylomonas sp. LL1]